MHAADPVRDCRRRETARKRCGCAERDSHEWGPGGCVGPIRNSDDEIDACDARPVHPLMLRRRNLKDDRGSVMDARDGVEGHGTMPYRELLDGGHAYAAPGVCQERGGSGPSVPG